jgi:sulfite oxidase
MTPPRLASRRRFLGQSLLGVGLGSLVGQSRAFSDDGIVHSEHPPNIETPISALRSWTTPNSAFFVRSHFEHPAVDIANWRLSIGGLVQGPVSLTLADLQSLPMVTIPALLQCSGNGREAFEPKVKGVAWGRGALGNAEWTGVRLADLLDRAGVKAEARHVHLLGADRGTNPEELMFLRSLPLDRARAESTLVAIRMNGEPLTVAHGAPARLVVPGWTGNNWVKWLSTITLADREAPGKAMQVSYRMPRDPSNPAPPPEQTFPLTWLNVKSLIVTPTRDATVSPGRVDVMGAAWSGEYPVARVEVALDDDPKWRPAQLVGPRADWTWRHWSFAWEGVKPGRHRIRSRATDSAGNTQPDVTPWNPGGYLWNGVDSVEFLVG